MAIRVKFDTLEDFIDEVVAECDAGGIDGDLVRAEKGRVAINNGVMNLMLQIGFLSDGQLREACFSCGEILEGGGTEAKDEAETCLTRLSSVLSARGLCLRGGRFDLVVS